MPKVTFIQGEKTVSVEAQVGDSILDIALANGIDMTYACGGMGVCTTCMVEVKDNKENLEEVTEEEKVMGFDDPQSTYRLGCQAKVTGDVTIELSY